MGRPLIDLTDKKFGKLTVRSLHPERKNNYACWNCVCDCPGAGEVTVKSSDLISGHVKSCGCLFADNKIDLTGQIFGRWEAIEYVESDELNNALWLCVCECGNRKLVVATRLIRGRSRSCGCLGKEITSARVKTHGQTNTPEFRSWAAAKGRCLNENNQAYHRYGARGITMHPEWINDFTAFLNHIGPMPKNDNRYSLDRIRNKEGYIPGNVRWATAKEQMNNRECNVYHEIDGKSLTIAQIADEYGLNSSTLNRRLKVLPVEEAVKPIQLTLESKYYYDNKFLTIKEWKEIFNFNFFELGNRLFSGWKFKEAIQPIEKKLFVYDEQTETLEWWCNFMELDKNSTYLEIIRGGSLKEIIERT